MNRNLFDWQKDIVSWSLKKGKADIVSRTLLSPTVLPIGALTSFLGAPLFLYLIIKRGGMK